MPNNASIPIATLEGCLRDLPRVQLGIWPTPLEAWPRISGSWGGPALLAKRDDLSGLALGGNKVRNLEFRMANAMAKGCDVIVMAREQYSNNARQTAAAAAKLGLRMVLLVPSEELVPMQGNRLLAEIVGAEVTVLSTEDPASVNLAIRDAIQAERAAGRCPYDNDAESPSAYAVLGYVAGAVELVRQLNQQRIEPAAIYVAAGNSQAGLLLGLRLLGYSWPVIGAAVEVPSEILVPRQLAAVTEAASMLGVLNPLCVEDFEVQDEPLGRGFQDVTKDVRDVIGEVGRLEAAILDPIYTAKVMVSLQQDIKAGRWSRGDQVIFIHTGGLPALFSMPYVDGSGSASARAT